MTIIDVFRKTPLNEQETRDLAQVQHRIGKLPSVLYLNGEPVKVVAIAMGNGHYVMLDGSSNSWRSAKSGTVHVTKTRPKRLGRGA